MNEKTFVRGVKSLTRKEQVAGSREQVAGSWLPGRVGGQVAARVGDMVLSGGNREAGQFRVAPPARRG